ncbi:MAG TPA: F0F1 ATP synthase subunit B [Saprospiraceae bacterium]|nr:F0F1 ATP synthase subunit B [Saprospiraceae bacterium]
MYDILLFAPFQPSPGLAIWSLVIFLLFWGIIGKLAFKPIVTALRSREDDIQKSLDSAKEAKKEMLELKAENDKIIAEAREESKKIVAEAKEMGNSIIKEAKDKAKEEASRQITNAKQEIESEKNKAIGEVKKEAGALAIAIAEKVLQKELSNKEDQASYANRLLSEINLS